jgi:hypothetical protein
MNLIENNQVEKDTQKVAQKTKGFPDHQIAMKKLDREVRRKRARQEDYSELIGQQVLP